jgi:ABC-type tungstate transport system, permease component
MTRGEVPNLRKTAGRAIFSLFLLLFAAACGTKTASVRAEAAYYLADQDPRKIVKIVECANSPAAQLLLMQFSHRFMQLAPVPPAWQTLPSVTEQDWEELRKPSVIGLYDFAFIGDEFLVKDLQRQGILRSAAPVFREEIILAGPQEALYSMWEMSLEEVMRTIAKDDLFFFSLVKNPWALGAEHELWRRSGTKAHEHSPKYVESGRDDVSALMQAGDEGAFILVGEGSYAQYVVAQRDLPALRKIAGTKIYRTTYACTMESAGFRDERLEIADGFLAWLAGEEGRALIESFELGGLSPFIPPPEERQ